MRKDEQEKTLELSAETSEKIVKSMTVKQKELYKKALMCESVSEMRLNNIFVSKGKKVEAIFAEKMAYSEFWAAVMDTWPEFAGCEAQIHKSFQVVFIKK